MGPYSLQALRDRIDWEGGYFDAVEYGISPDDIDDPEVAALWEALCALVYSAHELTDQLDELLSVTSE